MEEIGRFIDEWKEDALGLKPAFLSYYEGLKERDGVTLLWVERPGVSFSLRGTHENQTDRPLFVMLDIIDDDPGQRWLSVCFYGDMITDPDELGDLIPGGLLGADGYCFDISEQDDELREYIGIRIQEAYKNAMKS